MTVELNYILQVPHVHMLITPNGDKDNPPQIVDKSKQALLCTPESWLAVSPKAGCRRTALSQFPSSLLQVKTLGWGDFVSNRDYRRDQKFRKPSWNICYRTCQGHSGRGYPSSEKQNLSSTVDRKHTELELQNSPHYKPEPDLFLTQICTEI